MPQVLPERLRFLGSRALATGRAFLRREDGATAIEFGFVAAPFLALIFAIFQMAFVFFASQILETAASDAGRLVMTGQAQSMSASDFKDKVCAKIALIDCTSVYVDVKSAGNASALDVNKPIKNGKIDNNFDFKPGNAGDIVVVRVMYPLQTVASSLLGFNIADMNGGQRMLMATAAFRNEPYK